MISKTTATPIQCNRLSISALRCRKNSITVPPALLARANDVTPMSAFDAVDGSSTRHVSATEVGAVKAPTIRRS